MKRARPPHVHRAVVTGDIEAVRLYAEHGGKATAAKKRAHKKKKVTRKPLGWMKNTKKPSPETFQAELRRRYGD